MKRAWGILMFFARVAMAAIFLLAAKEKIADPAAFALAVYRYRIVPSWGVNVFALLLPWVEVFAAVALLAPRRAGMLAMFTVAYGIALLRGISISCGCFSLSPDEVAGGWHTLAQNAALFAGGVVIFADTFFRTVPDEPEST